MGLGSLVENALKSGASLKKLIKEDYAVVEDIPYLVKDSWVRSSGFPMLCPREEVLCSTHKVERTWEINADLNLIFQHGHGLHHQLQNEILPSVGVLRGKWVCQGCGAMHGGPVDPKARVETWAEPKPEGCPDCSGKEFLFHEVKMFNEDHRVSGHCDGFLELDGVPGMGIVEGKSIGQGWQVQNVPKLDHVIQLQTYLWLADLQWGIILYWQKGVNGVGALIEHFVERDEDTIDNIKATLKSIWNGVETGELPDKVCETSTCKRAKSCAVRNQCFGITDESE